MKITSNSEQVENSDKDKKVMITQETTHMCYHAI